MQSQVQIHHFEAFIHQNTRHNLSINKTKQTFFYFLQYTQQPQKKGFISHILIYMFFFSNFLSFLSRKTKKKQKTKRSVQTKCLSIETKLQLSTKIQTAPTLQNVATTTHKNPPNSQTVITKIFICLNCFLLSNKFPLSFCFNFR